MRKLGLERPPVDLARAEARQRLFREDDLLGNFELGDPPVEELAELGFGQFADLSRKSPPSALRRAARRARRTPPTSATVGQA